MHTNCHPEPAGEGSVPLEPRRYGSFATLRMTRVLRMTMLVLIALTACAPSTPANPARSAERPAAPKILTIAIQREPNILHRTLSTGVPSVGGVNQTFHIPHDHLVVANDTNGFQPVLATDNISVERGTWRVNPDGTMETTWKLHPNVKWHDGVPFTAEDMVFSLHVYKDP